MDHQTFAQLLGNYGEFVGAIAVVATLAYLAVQVRQSNRIETAESIRSTTNAYINTILQVNSPLFRRAMVDFEGLSGDDQMTIHNYLIAMFLIAQTEVTLSERGLGELSDYPPLLASMTRAPGIQQWWAKVGPTFSPGFHTYIDELRDSERYELPVHEILPWFAANTELSKS